MTPQEAINDYFGIDTVEGVDTCFVHAHRIRPYFDRAKVLLVRDRQSVEVELTLSPSITRHRDSDDTELFEIPVALVVPLGLEKVVLSDDEIRRVINFSSLPMPAELKQRFSKAPNK